jgi:hypothetical protein
MCHTISSALPLIFFTPFFLNNYKSTSKQRAIFSTCSLVGIRSFRYFMQGFPPLQPQAFPSVSKVHAKYCWTNFVLSSGGKP